jgi:hypothetical protein
MFIHILATDYRAQKIPLTGKVAAINTYLSVINTGHLQPITLAVCFFTNSS